MNSVDANIKHSLNQLTHRPVRDLAWTLLSPLLFCSLPQTPKQWWKTDWLADDLWSWLRYIDRHPSDLFAHLQDQRATRLGIYFEQLLSFYFSHHPSFTLVCKNLQANSLERTIGEYDFIVLNNHTNEYYHIEVAVKFYLGFQSLDVNIPKNAPLYNWHYWLGPNKKDTLAIKMRHLLEHQLRLSEKSAGIDALRTIGIKPGQLNIRLLMTGRFYYPAPEDLSISLAAPEYSNPQGRQKQYWFSAEYISHYLLKNNTATSVCMDGNVTDIAYTIIPRQQWMSDLALADIAIFSLTLLSREQLLVAIEEQVTHQKQQLHIAELTKVPTQPWQEEQRFFVIP